MGEMNTLERVSVSKMLLAKRSSIQHVKRYNKVLVPVRQRFYIIKMQLATCITPSITKSQLHQLSC